MTATPVGAATAGPSNLSNLGEEKNDFFVVIDTFSHYMNELINTCAVSSFRQCSEVDHSWNSLLEPAQVDSYRDNKVRGGFLSNVSIIFTLSLFFELEPPSFRSGASDGEQMNKFVNANLATRASWDLTAQCVSSDYWLRVLVLYVYPLASFSNSRITWPQIYGPF